MTTYLHCALLLPSINARWDTLAYRKVEEGREATSFFLLYEPRRKTSVQIPQNRHNIQSLNQDKEIQYLLLARKEKNNIKVDTCIKV